MAATPELARAGVVDLRFTSSVESSDYPEPHSSTTPQEAGLSKKQYLDLFGSQLACRHLDLQARILKDKQEGFYTIGSSGHEGNAATALAFGVDDLAFLHYRSGAFVIQRAKMKGGHDPIYEQLLSLVASSEDPISGGRHKVFGSLDLNIPPQTSTIASHLPKSTGAAFGMTIRKSLELAQAEGAQKRDSVVLCSFGDGSANHSTALGGFNAAVWAVEHQVPMPIVFICEDNGMAISVPTPSHWIHNLFCDKTGLHYLSCDGRNISDVYQKAKVAHDLAKKGQPVFLHMRTVRLLGHAGSDIEFHYNSLKEVEQRESDDPLLHTARSIEESGWLSSKEIIELYESIRTEVHAKAQKAILRPRLESAAQVMNSLIPPESNKKPPPLPTTPARKTTFGRDFDKLSKPKNLSQTINSALTDLMTQYPNACVFGEDVGKKGGIYRVTQDLQRRFGQARVFDTILDEQTILGTAIGFGHSGLLPIPEIQFLAYTHNASDQIRGEAATLSFFSQGQFTNPMVIRIAGLGYQKGFGGHFHNDNAFGFLREIPGITIACPSRASDGARLLRACVQMAALEQRVVIFLEPIALYMTKDLYHSGDGLALEPYPDLEEIAGVGEVGVEGKDEELAIISYGNGAHLSRQAIKDLEGRGHHIKLIDLKWLHPLPQDSLKKALLGVKKILIIDECRKTGSLSEEIISWMVESYSPLPTIKRLTAQDSFIPIGKSWQYLLPSKESIVEALQTLIKNTSLVKQVS